VTRVGYLLSAWLFVIGVVIQVLLVGLSLLGRVPSWDTHIGLGHTIGIFPLLALVFAYVGRLPRTAKVQSAVIFGTYLFQAEVFAGIRDIAPLAAALHPVLALALFYLGLRQALEAQALIRPSMVEPAPVQQPTLVGQVGGTDSADAEPPGQKAA
jgi:hypothetical protein